MMYMRDSLANNPLKSFHVLIVDNDPKLVRLLKNILHAFGFTSIDVAHDGSEAFEKLIDRKYDIIILDWMMQPMDGLSFVKKLRNDETNKNIFSNIIMLSGRAERENIIKARDAGVTEFMAKPFSIAGFRERIIAIIESPREFVMAPTYAGPTRRRRNLNPPDGVERREI